METSELLRRPRQAVESAAATARRSMVSGIRNVMVVNFCSVMDSSTDGLRIRTAGSARLFRNRCEKRRGRKFKARRRRRGTGGGMHRHPQAFARAC